MQCTRHYLEYHVGLRVPKHTDASLDQPRRERSRVSASSRKFVRNHISVAPQGRHGDLSETPCVFHRWAKSLKVFNPVLQGTTDYRTLQQPKTHYAQAPNHYYSLVMRGFGPAEGLTSEQSEMGHKQRCADTCCDVPGSSLRRPCLQRQDSGEALQLRWHHAEADGKTRHVEA